MLLKPYFLCTNLSFIFQTLERNVSLSSGYLEELSVQYKKQIEDLQMSMRQATEALTVAAKVREKDQLAVQSLQNEMANLSSVVVHLTLQIETLRTWVSSLFELAACSSSNYALINVGNLFAQVRVISSSGWYKDADLVAQISIIMSFVQG